MRSANIIRNTKETQIKLLLNLDGTGKCDIKTGIGFLNHMLELFVFHSNIDITLNCNGDLAVDDHHTVEDIGIAIGQAFKMALGDKLGIERYGSFYMPMDEALALVAIDISGRSFLVFDVEFKRENIGDISTEMFKEFFRAFASEMGLTIHIKILHGENDHHKIEAIFKGVARSLKKAIKIDKNNMTVQSSKGVL